MEIAAYHEAGHGVMAVMLGGEVSGLSIATDEQWSVGDAIVRWTGGGGRQQFLVNDIKTALAGPVSEMVYIGDYDYLRIRSEHVADWQIVQDNLKQLHLEEAKRATFLEQVVGELYRTVRDDRVWSAIGDVAELLLLDEAIDGQAVHEATEFWLRR